MTSPQIQTAFSAGEISPELYGQVSLNKYASAATTARNGIVSYHGGFLSRGGFAYVLRSKQAGSDYPPRLIPFQFSITQGVMIEAGDHYFRFIINGGYVLEAGIAITGVTNANPAVVSVTGTPFSNGDWVFFSGVGGMTQLNGNTYIVAAAGAGSFALHDLNGNPVNSTAYGVYTSGGTVSRIYTVATPYLALDLPYLKYAQSADVMAMTCSNPISGNEYGAKELARLGNADWTLTNVPFNATLSPPTSVSASANRAAPSGGINATFNYRVTAVDKDGNESRAGNIGVCNGADLAVEGGTNTVTWSMVAGAKYYNIYRAPPSANNGSGVTIPVPRGSVFGYSGSSYGTQFLDNAATVDLTQVPPLHLNPFARGQILGINITSGGSGVSAVTYAITTAGGSGFYGYPVVSGNQLTAFPIEEPGHDYAPGDSIAFNGAGFATGAIVFAANPTNGDTITLNSVVWTFVTTITAINQTKITGALSDTLSSLVTDVSASSNALLTVASYATDDAGTDFIITYNTAGTGGNAYTLAASAATPSGATLTGGGGFAGTNPTGTLIISPTTGTYPGICQYFQQRRFFANSFNNPDTFWASQTGRFSNFDTRIPTVPNDAITASPWTEQVDGIQWLVPMPGGLITLTGGRAWQILGSGSYALSPQPITPATTQAQPQSFNGCSATAKPFVENFDLIYVEAVSNSVVRDLSWNFYTNIYTGADLTILSSHLFNSHQCVQIAWARQPYRTAWYVRDDGIMLSLTYMKEQEVYGWARHDTQGLIVSVETVIEPPVNAVYIAVKRFPPYAANGIYTIERKDNRLWQSVEDAYAVDSGVSNPMSQPAATITASAASGAGVTFATSASVFSAGNVGNIIRMSGGIATITGYTSATLVTGTWNLAASNSAAGFPTAISGAWSLSVPVTTLSAPHLAGMRVNVLADGRPITGITVAADGTITLPFAASNVKAGLPFSVQLQTPYLNGGEPTMQGRRKVIPSATIRVSASGSGFKVGTNQPDGAALNPPQIAPTWNLTATADAAKPTGGQSAVQTYTSPGGQTITQLWTGDILVTGSDAAWNSKGQVAIEQDLPLALEVLAVVPNVLDGDTSEVTYRPQQNQPPPGPHMGMIGRI